jgi:hypothetical protein
MKDIPLIIFFLLPKLWGLPSLASWTVQMSLTFSFSKPSVSGPQVGNIHGPDSTAGQAHCSEDEHLRV